MPPYCYGLSCSECPIDQTLCRDRLINALEIIKIVEKWGKEHPATTNADKFKEVFGSEPIKVSCPFPCDGRNCVEWPHRDFWEQEYKG